MSLPSPTTEQQAIIEFPHNAKIIAFAGTGKTSTLIHYALNHQNKRLLYVAFNKSVKLEAIKKFQAAGCRNVKVETVHSLAYRHMRVWERFQLLPNGNLRTSDIQSLCALPSSLDDGGSALVLSRHIHNLLTQFCNSAAANFNEIDYPASVSAGPARDFATQHLDLIRHHARDLLTRMFRSDIPLFHDAYLKFFQLQNVDLGYDGILVDEAQDSNKAMMDIFFRQRRATKTLVGDRHQSIYRFRGALNSLDCVDYPEFPLTQSFRFDQDVADTAMAALSLKSLLGFPVETNRIIGLGGQAPVRQKAILARSNVSLLKEAIDLVLHGARRLCFEGGLESYTYMAQSAPLFDILYLKLCQPGKIKSPFIRSFGHFDELEDYHAQTADQELGLAINIVNKFGISLLDYVRRLKNLQVDKDQAEYVFSTCHRAKGQEYGQVTLTGDFINGAQIRNQLNKVRHQKKTGHQPDIDLHALNEEINLVYVALTRTSNELILPFDLDPSNDEVNRIAPAA